MRQHTFKFRGREFQYPSLALIAAQRLVDHDASSAAKRLPLAPAVSKKRPIEAACPIQIVADVW